jgi:hypothetical protein
MIRLKDILNEIMEGLPPPPPPPAIIQQLPSINTNAIADAIYRIEGGSKTKYPYGISMKKAGIQTRSIDDARRICINTINHAYKDWVNVGHRDDFIDFLSKRYCHENHTAWANMIRKIIKK